MLLEPVGEALVQLGAGRLRERVVGGVADQQVTEAERVLAGQLRLVGPDQLLAHERGEPRRDLRLARGRAPATAPRWKTCPRPSRARAPPLVRVELVEPRGEQRLDRRRNGDARPADSRTSASISSTNSGLPSAAVADALASFGSRPRRRAARDQLVGLGRVERLEQHRRRVQLAAAPARAAVEQLRPRQAEEQDRRVARQSAMCSTRSRNVGSAQWMSSKTTTSGRSAAAASSSLRTAQAISSADARCRLAEQRRDAPRRARRRGSVAPAAASRPRPPASR